MASWIFEPGHTEAEFRARHMMVTWVRGMFKDIHGTLEFDWDSCLEATFEGRMDASKLWTGESERDAHHGSKYAQESGHPILRSLEPGEDWCWCFLDEAMFVVAFDDA